MNFNIDVNTSNDKCGSNVHDSITLNNSSISSVDQIELLAKLDAANRFLEADTRSVKNLSRRDSGCSQISSISNLSAFGVVEEDETESSWVLWGQIVHDWEKYSKKKSYMKELIRKGIPHCFRSLIWQEITGVSRSKLQELYAEYLKCESPCEKAIRRDIARTFPNIAMFKEKDGIGQEALFNVMKAYSIHDREVGYCQGSGFIVGILLIQMPEEAAFAVLVKLMQNYSLRELFKPSMAHLGLCIYQLENLLQEYLPGLFLHFQTQGFHTTIYAASWFLTIFSTTFTLSVASRIMDIFVSEGMEVLFRIAVAFLKLSQDELLTKDMEGMLRLIQNDIPRRIEEQIETLFETAYSLSYCSKKMNRLEKEYTVNRTKEQEEQVEMRKLSTENTLLIQRIQSLEMENEMLADKLVSYQVTRAEEAEETYALRRQVRIFHRQCEELSRKLEQADIVISQLKISLPGITPSIISQSESENLLCQHSSLTDREETSHCE